MINWDDLRYILTVHRHGSLAAAAKVLGQNKSTVGRRIAALEEALGVSLLARKSAGYEMTAAGGRAKRRRALAFRGLPDPAATVRL